LISSYQKQQQQHRQQQQHLQQSEDKQHSNILATFAIQSKIKKLYNLFHKISTYQLLFQQLFASFIIIIRTYKNNYDDIIKCFKQSYIIIIENISDKSGLSFNHTHDVDHDDDIHDEKEDEVDHNAGTVVNINSYVDYDILNDTIDDSNSRYK